MLDLEINIQEATMKTDTMEPGWAVYPILCSRSPWQCDLALSKSVH